MLTAWNPLLEISNILLIFLVIMLSLKLDLSISSLTIISNDLLARIFNFDFSSFSPKEIFELFACSFISLNFDTLILLCVLRIEFF